MATASFPADDVLKNARAAFRRNEDARAKYHEEQIKQLMEIEQVKWEWRSLIPNRVTYYRDREEAEKHYGSVGSYHRTMRYWSDSRFNPKKLALESVIKLALSSRHFNTPAHARVVLDDAEAQLIDLHIIPEELDARQILSGASNGK
jgi:hypothetical protein